CCRLAQRRFGGAACGAAVPVHPVMVIALLERRIKDSVAAACHTAVGAAASSRPVAIRSPRITFLAGIFLSVPAEDRKHSAGGGAGEAFLHSQAWFAVFIQCVLHDSVAAEALLKLAQVVAAVLVARV